MMSTKYENSRDVPSEVLVVRMRELADAVTCGQKGLDREFTMRVPAECDRDADLVLCESARRLATLEAENKALREALGPLADTVNAFANFQSDQSETMVMLKAGDARRAAALLEKK